MTISALARRWARRELRGGFKGFGIFLACLVLGVAVIAGIGSLSAAIDAGLEDNARALLGGDLDFVVAQAPITPAERSFLRAQGQVSEIARLRAMAVSENGNTRSLIELKAVDNAYPLYGAVTLAPGESLAQALQFRNGAWGAVVAPELLDRLKLKLGDTIRIGQARLRLRAVIAHEPDNVTGLFAFGPRVMIADGALDATRLIAPGTLVDYTARLKLKPGLSAATVMAEARAQFPKAGWRMRDFANAAPSLQELINRVTVFLTLVGLTALLVGGVGIGNAIESYLDGKIATIATLKCLGASRALIFATYLMQILALAALGIAAGLVIGAAAPLAVAPVLPSLLPVTAQAGLYPAPLALAAIYGLLATLAFAAWPIGKACDVPAAALFRSLVAPSRARPGLLPAAIVIGAGAALAALAYLTAPDKRIALWFILGAIASLIAFRLLALLLVQAARLAGRPHRPSLRLALANLYRPGAATASVVASLGLGLAVLVAVILVHGDLLNEIGESLPARAPSFFFIDIQPDQIAAFDKLLAGMKEVSAVHQAPSLRGRIVALNGVPVARAHIGADARWATNSDRGLTYAATLPPGSQLVAGQWWPADYKGPPLVSFAADLARGMDLKPGDTITINVLGRDVTATIANLRQIDWTSLNINFAMVFSPGTFAGAPHSYIATARTPSADEAQLQRAVTDAFPNVSAIGVRDALETIGTIIAAIGTAVQITAAVTLIAGVLVLAGAIAAGRRRRIYEAVMLKVLGATRAQIAASFLIEYGLLGLAAALLAALIGTAAAYFVLTRVMHAAWRFLPGEVAATIVIAALVTLAIGFAGTWRALGAKPAPYLREE